MANKSECVKVAVRVRPLNSKEINEGDTSIIEVNNECTPNEIYIKCKDFDGSESQKAYAFDHVFDLKTKQIDLYNKCASPIIDSVLKGYNGTLFAYGQTGTGKTFTMEGNVKDEINAGIIPRTFKQIMDYVNNSAENIEFLVRISFLEIYQEEVYDLLCKNTRQKLTIRENKKGFYVSGLTMYSVKSEKDMYKVFKKGNKSRSIGATAMNPGSSRSHCILTIIVESQHIRQDNSENVLVGKLNLVDLAGSERQKKTLSQGDRLTEAKFINLSLSALGNVIKALTTTNNNHIPFRDSKLTRLLSDSLGGNTKTLMIANIGPASTNFDETMSTLRYANRAKNIKNKPKINEDPKDAMIRKMKMELNNLRKQLENNKLNLNYNNKIQLKEKEKLKLKAVNAKNKFEELQELYKKDEKKYEIAKMEAEKAANSAENNLKIAENKLKNEQKELIDLENKLKLKTHELIHGGKKLNKAMKAERELAETSRKLIETEKSQQHFIKELDSIIENKQYLVSKFGEIKDEISDTTFKLKTLWKKYQEKINELKDLEEENLFEEKELTENITQLTQQYKLKEIILKYFIPNKWLEFIEQHSQFDNNIDQWRIPALQYSMGNNNNNNGEILSDERVLTNLKITQIWKRLQMINNNNNNNNINKDVMRESLNSEIEEAIHCAINTNIDPNQYGDKVYLTYDNL